LDSRKRREGFGMAIKVGVAPGTWGVRSPNEPGGTPWDVFLDESADAGYRWIELGPYAYLPTDVDVLRAELDKRDLRVTSTLVMNGHLERPEDWSRIEQEVIRAGELGASVGAKHMVLIDDFHTDTETGTPILPPELDADGWQRLIEATHRVADLARERFGLPVAFHPHTSTHIETERQVEAFLRDTDADRVSLCLDTGHHAFCGGDPVEFMRKYHERISYLHLKSPDRVMLERVRTEGIPLERATELGVFRELSLGMIDFREMAKVVKDTGFDGWMMVELEVARRPAPGVTLPIARRTRQYLSEIGIG
jgi:inosose dehydratase